MASIASPSIFIIALAYMTCFVMGYIVPRSLWATSILVTLPTVFAYVLNFRLQRAAVNDFEDRIWHAERMRGLQAGSDVDGDGEVTDEERTKESAEWANALLRGIWPIMNPDLYVTHCCL